MTKKTPVNIDFKIKSIELLSSCINVPQKQLSDAPVFYYDINLEHKLSKKNKIVIVLCSISIYSEKKEELLGQLKLSCIFQVINLDEFISKDTNQLKLPDDFITTLNSISISTSRGILFSSFRGTILHNAILPLVNPNELKINKEGS